MIESKAKKAKQEFLDEIVQDIKEIPPVYLKTLYALIHSFKENILVLENPKTKKSLKSKKDETSEFDWDNLVDEIHQNRKQNNKKRSVKINQLFSE